MTNSLFGTYYKYADFHIHAANPTTVPINYLIDSIKQLVYNLHSTSHFVLFAYLFRQGQVYWGYSCQTVNYLFHSVVIFGLLSPYILPIQSKQWPTTILSTKHHPSLTVDYDSLFHHICINNPIPFPLPYSANPCSTTCD